MAVLPSSRVRQLRPDWSIGQDLHTQAKDDARSAPDTGATYFADAHPGHARVGLPPGKTEFDWEAGTVTWIEDGDGGSRSEDLEPGATGNLTKVENMDQVAENDKQVLRSLLTFVDDDATLYVGGGQAQLDPCMYFPIPDMEFTKFTVEVSRPADLYGVASTRTNAFANLGPLTIHLDRSGGFGAATPANDSWETVEMTVSHLTDDNGVAESSAKAAGKMHVQNTPIRTIVVENVHNSNDLQYRVQGMSGHHGTGRWVTIDSGMPNTVTAGSVGHHTNVNEAWHLQRVQVTNDVNGEDVHARVDYTAVG